MKLLNLFAVKNQVNNSLFGDCSRLKQAENEALHTISSGRSMVEMLGVLAIIGVLSVGAISGYSTAMYKYRMNKTVQAVTDVMQNLAELSTKNWGGEVITTSSTQYVKYGLLPASMCPEDYVNAWGETGSYCKLPLGEVGMYFQNEAFLNGYFHIIFYEGDIVKSCVDFLSHGWQNMYPQDWLRTDEGILGSMTVVGNGVDNQVLWAVQPEKAGVGKKDITLSDIQNACDVCKEGEFCDIGMSIN